MIRLQPDWIGELLGHWAKSDWDQARDDLGFPQVSPMFAKAVGTILEAEDVTGYSSAETRAMAAAVSCPLSVPPQPIASMVAAISASGD